MKTVSITDLQLIPELSHLRMLDFINPDNDKLIAPFLKVMGFDLDYPVQFMPSQHRNLQGKVVIAYMLIGDVECNDSFLSSSWATVEDRVVVAGYRDLGFSDDLAASSSLGREWETEAPADGFPPELTNPDEKDILMQIKVLDDLLLEVRGSPFKQDGSRKTLAEQHLVEIPEKHRKKAVKKEATTS